MVNFLSVEYKTFIIIAESLQGLEIFEIEQNVLIHAKTQEKSKANTKYITPKYL